MGNGEAGHGPPAGDALNEPVGAVVGTADAPGGVPCGDGGLVGAGTGGAPGCGDGVGPAPTPVATLTPPAGVPLIPQVGSPCPTLTAPVGAPTMFQRGSTRCEFVAPVGEVHTSHADFGAATAPTLRSRASRSVAVSGAPGNGASWKSSSSSTRTTPPGAPRILNRGVLGGTIALALHVRRKQPSSLFRREPLQFVLLLRSAHAEQLPTVLAVRERLVHERRLLLALPTGDSVTPLFAKLPR